VTRIRKPYHVKQEEDDKEDAPGEVAVVTLQFSSTTMRLLERLANMGIGVEGVCEGFVYRGLQATTELDEA
jgi:hypothetical protein